MVSLNLNLCLAMQMPNNININILKSMPSFYQDVWQSYYRCKTIKSLEHMNSYDFLSSTIWGNELFKFKNKCLFFKHWIDSNIVYVRDLFNRNGNMHAYEYVLNKLTNTRNWLIEYSMIKKYSPILLKSLTHQ